MTRGSTCTAGHVQLLRGKPPALPSAEAIQGVCLHWPLAGQALPGSLLLWEVPWSDSPYLGPWTCDVAQPGLEYQGSRPRVSVDTLGRPLLNDWLSSLVSYIHLYGLISLFFFCHSCCAFEKICFIVWDPGFHEFSKQWVFSLWVFHIPR